LEVGVGGPFGVLHVPDSYCRRHVSGSKGRGLGCQMGGSDKHVFFTVYFANPCFRIHLACYSWSNGNYETQIGERGWMCPGDLRKDELGTLRCLYSAGEEMRRRARGMISC